MEFRCSPYIPLIFVGILGILIFCSLPSSAQSQCNGDFTYQAFSSDSEVPSGKIEISLKAPEPGSYVFKVYSINGKITLVQTRHVQSPQKITLERLPSATYLVKIEWGDNCYRTVGGLEGILITDKSPSK